jgi:hypothetical protein
VKRRERFGHFVVYEEKVEDGEGEKRGPFYKNSRKLYWRYIK